MSTTTTDQPTALNFDQDYAKAMARFTEAVAAIEMLGHYHNECADEDRNGFGQINYGFVAELNAAADLVERDTEHLG